MISDLSNLDHKLQVVKEDLRKRGFLVNTAFNYGYHFSIRKKEKDHASHLVLVIDDQTALLTPLTHIRHVRLGQSFHKNILLAYVTRTGKIKYTEISPWG